MSMAVSRNQIGCATNPTKNGEDQQCRMKTSEYGRLDDMRVIDT